uniref:Uncharacterized protein n=1 Tax=Alexandrium catenella TaxID=2925 RepID=A0A7S1L650_ALECA|mmetsp:Transcript_106999/g.284710  ORF Transcript_106999/g.284710 Transcript_106999/m.284710 type:complete len:188 (+) Transcript_106999:125-688(+)
MRSAVSGSLILFLAFAPVTVPGARANRDLGTSDAFTARDDCEVKQQQLKEVAAGLEHILEARTRIHVLLKSNWKRFFAGSRGNDTFSERVVGESLEVQHRTLRALTQVGRRRSRELSAAVEACSAADSGRRGAPARNASHFKGIGFGGHALKRFRNGRGFNSGLGLQGRGHLLAELARAAAHARGIG